jgi:hypothetical protein
MGPEGQKSRGAYYTDPIIARFLLRFAAAMEKSSRRREVRA